MSKAGVASMAPLPVVSRLATTTPSAARRAGHPPPFGTHHRATSACDTQPSLRSSRSDRASARQQTVSDFLDTDELAEAATGMLKNTTTYAHVMSMLLLIGRNRHLLPGTIRLAWTPLPRLGRRSRKLPEHVPAALGASFLRSCSRLCSPPLVCMADSLYAIVCYA